MGMNVAKLLSNKWAKTGGAGHEHGSPQGKEQVVINKEL